MTTTTQQAPADSAYEPVIGLEVHAQLATSSKMFCGCSRDYWEADPNSNVCPVCLGMPGVLPVINRRAVELTILTGQRQHERDELDRPGPAGSCIMHHGPFLKLEIQEFGFLR